MDYDDVRSRIIEEASKCSYCGFCEQSCPTLPLGPHRGYGPRGRVYLALLFRKKVLTETREFRKSVFTCLLCAACTLNCPAGIDVPNLVRLVRHVLLGEIEAA